MAGPDRVRDLRGGLDAVVLLERREKPTHRNRATH